MNKIKAIIFDFDGVIAESVNVKTEAFAEIYKPYGDDVVRKVVEHHLANGGVSRFEKFKIYHNNYLGKSISDDEIQKLAKEFSNLVLTKVVESPYVKGAYEFISGNYKKYDLFISSGTPQNEIREIAKRRNIAKYFKGIFGSPLLKSEHTKKIMKKKNYKNDEVVFIGDAPSDSEAAIDNDIFFIARVNDEKSPLKGEKNKIEDLRYLKNKLIEITD